MLLSKDNTNLTTSSSVTSLAGACTQEVNEESNGVSHVDVPVPSAHSSGRLLRSTVPSLSSTLNLFEVSNIPSLHDRNLILGSEKNSTITPRSQNFQENMHRASSENVMMANFRHNAPPSLAQQLYRTSNFQPSKDYELVKEINLQPRIKASPRAATFLKFTTAQKSDVVLDSCVDSSSNSHLHENSSLKMNSQPVSDPVFHRNIMNKVVETTAGDKQPPEASPHVSFLDIRFARKQTKSSFEHSIINFQFSKLMHQASQKYASQKLAGKSCSSANVILAIFKDIFSLLFDSLFLLGHQKMPHYIRGKNRCIFKQGC